MGPGTVVANNSTFLYVQIQKVVMALGDYMGASCHACIGGTNVRAEVQKLQMEAPHIIVGTPGRVFDMLNRRYLCEYLNFLVLWVTSLFCSFPSLST